jgi:hypothetical protein
LSEFETDTKMIENLASVAHELFCEYLVAKGYRYGPETSETAKIHSSLVPFDALPKDEKEQNRSIVRDIPRKLAYVGYGLQVNLGDQKAIQFQEEEIEKLAKREHEYWVKEKLGRGWQHGKITNKADKKHKDLVPWDMLSEEDKEKDRVIIRAIPKILARAGYVMIKINPRN